MTKTSTKEELFNSINETVAELASLISSLDESEINAVPFKDSWTAGQLIRHITKSTNGMAKVMLAESKIAERDATEKVDHLKSTFLDFDQKFQSPEFNVPENEIYHKASTIAELDEAFQLLKKNGASANPQEIVEGLPFGPTTKVELLHFVLYHTQRHLHQLRKIVEGLKQIKNAN